MSDNLGLFQRHSDDTGSLDLTELRAALARNAADPAPPPPPPPPSGRRDARARREELARRKRRHRRHTLVALVVLLVLAAAITTVTVIWRKNSAVVADFTTGSAGQEIIVRVQSGDSRDDIAVSLREGGVVASDQAFLDRTTTDADVQKIKPGYFRLRTHLSAQEAANALVDPANRVGQLRLIPGRQLADVSTKTGGGGTVTPGFITDITKAACVPLNGVSHCWTADDLWKVAETADPISLGVVDWGIDGVNAAPDPRKRLEGMIVPGDYDVPPNSTPLQALQSVLGGSAANWNTTDIVADAKLLGFTPYQTATIASLVEREGNTADMPKVARVILNRYQERMKFQLDSTVNYALNRAQISTTATDRANPSPYNTYFHAGLPPTPISSPGDAALAATLDPADGTWLFFVKVDKQGNSCFSVTEAEHEKCVELARKNGVFDE